MTNPDAPSPLILLPGLGADDRLFAGQKPAFPQLITPHWIAPAGDTESLSDYAARFARQLDPGHPCFVGGASLGGFVAREAARHFRAPLAVFLIGSVKGPHEFPRRIRALRYLLPIHRFLPFRALPPLIRATTPLCRFALTPAVRSLLDQLADADPRFVRWACRALLEWQPTPLPPGLPIFHIHGARDRVLPARRTSPDMLLPTAGHLLSMTHAADVNQFLADHMTIRDHPPRPRD